MLFIVNTFLSKVQNNIVHEPYGGLSSSHSLRTSSDIFFFSREKYLCIILSDKKKKKKAYSHLFVCFGGKMTYGEKKH